MANDDSYRAVGGGQAAPRRLLLDTNVWAQLCDFEGREKLRALYKDARSKGVQIVVAPPVVYEVMARPREHASAKGLRDRAWVLSRTWWAREPSDAYLEAGEVYNALAKHRPQWLRRRRQDMLDALANDWTMRQQSLPLSLARELVQGEVSGGVMATRVGDRVRVPGFWTRLQDSPELFAALMRSRQAELDQARSSLKATKLTEATALQNGPPTTTVGGREVHAWRAWAALTMPSMLLADLWKAPGARGVLDFLDLVVDLNKAFTSQRSWESLWLDEVAPEDVPHHWLRGTAHPFQIAGRISPGTPGDNQLIAYLFRVHDLVSADKGLIRLVEQLADCEPPCDVARGHRVRQGSETFGELLALIDEQG